MKREIKTMSLYSECDGYRDDESSKIDQPVDLRVCSARERDNRGEHSNNRDKSGNNYILASLLKRNSSPFSKYDSYETMKSEADKISKYESHQLSMVNAHLHQRVPSEYCRDDEPRYKDSKTSIRDRLHFKQAFVNKYQRSCGSPSSPGMSPSSTSTCNDLENSSRNFGMKSSPERQFVPNYRKFYSRCFNQSPTREKEPNPVNVDTSYNVIKERLSSNSTPSNSSTGHLYRLLQKDSLAPPVKRKMTFSVDTNSRKDKTLRCLLSTSVEDHSVQDHSNRSLDRPSYALSDYNLIKPRLKMRIDSKHDIYPRFLDGRYYDVGNKKDTYARPLHPRYQSDDYTMRPPHIYCPQPVRVVPSDTVLKSILVSESKIPAPVLPTSSGPPSSGSPGSESTSSGSTDSGVFSDNVVDDRRRVARVLSGRHVKSGTGASISTLRLLRQMILQRKNKHDRNL
ncbi:hypothetical protein JTE90_016367 [Oedothorax gibbosus]|uniref:Uncharacterized protein n=1 Tax=Oedothorax gibbosus TaxID=931172 RepID=A0AAV6U957_9ARAC|nr:hypothetical protein JTE90_016367 [Oedothorax gibbosus]